MSISRKAAFSSATSASGKKSVQTRTQEERRGCAMCMPGIFTINGILSPNISAMDDL